VGVILELEPKRDLVLDHMAYLCHHAAFPVSTVTCNHERYMNLLLPLGRKIPLTGFLNLVIIIPVIFLPLNHSNP
jgi:hypothetical protein